MKQIVTIKGKPVTDIYESLDGSYWFITERSHKQDSIINGKVYHNDQILFGFVRLAACPDLAEWGYVSETELKLLGGRVWKVPKINWPACPLVEVTPTAEPRQEEDKEESSFPGSSASTLKRTERGCL